MKKKVIGSSILLAVLLLGLFTTSYADINRTWTDVELKNVIYRYYVYYRGINETTVINYIDGHQSNIDTLLNKINSSNLVTICNNGGYGLVFLFPASSNPGYYLYNNKLQISNRVAGDIGYYFGWGSLGFNSRTNLSDFSSYRIYYDYLYTSVNISQNGVVTYPSGYYTPSTFFDEWYYEDTLPFAFVTEPGLGTVMYDNYEYTLYNKTSSGDILLGQLFVPNGIVVNYLDVLNHYWYWNNWQVREFTDNSIRTQLVSNNDGDLVFNVYLKREYIYTNTYYQYIFTSQSTEPYQFVSGGCYIKDSHTVITSGVVDPYNTFSGDYKDEYDSIIDNQQDVNNISEAIGDTILDDSEVDNMLSGFNTSGDILNTLGYSPIENPFSSVILRVMQALNDVLLGSGDVTLDISAFDLDMELNSSDFTLPAGLIKNFVSLVSNGFVIWLIYKYGFKLYMMINTGKFKNLIDETTNTNVNLF